MLTSGKPYNAQTDIKNQEKGYKQPSVSQQQQEAQEKKAKKDFNQ